jgi:hypothetical protein
MEPEGSSPHSQVPATCPCPEPPSPSPYPSIPLPEDPTEYHLLIYAWVPQWSLFLRFPHQNPVYVSHLPIRATCQDNLILRVRLLCGTDGYPPNVLQPTQAYCTNPCFSFPPSSPEALHIRRRERPLLVTGGTMSEKCPIKFSLQLRLPR